MNKLLSIVLVCMLFFEAIMLLLWLLAILGISPVPANVIPMQAIALVTLITATGITYIVHKRKQKQ